MIRTQRWLPDTCASPATGDVCSVLEEWDDSLPDIARTHGLKTVEKTCSLHAGLSGEALYDALMEDNRRKNVTWAIVQTVKGTLTYDQYRWSYDANRVLIVDFGADLTNAQKTALRNAAGIQFGPGKVTVL